MIHVLHVITGLGVGGAETALLRLAGRLPGLGVRTSVVALGPEAALAEPLRRTGATVDCLDLGSSVPSPPRLAGLVRILRDRRPDVVQTWMYHANLVGGVLARLATPAPVAWNLRNSTLERGSGTSVRTRLVVRACTALSRCVPARIVSCSRVALDAHAALGYPRARMVHVPNGFDLDVLRPRPEQRAALRRELGLPQGAPVVGSFARLHAQKDLPTLFAALARSAPDVRLVLAGMSADDPALGPLLDAAGVRERVQLLGRRADVPRLFSALDVLTTSSAFGEAFPQVVGEGMASGVPCVVTDVGDSAEIVGDTGRVVPPRRPDALAAAWAEILALPAAARSELGLRARQRVADHYELGAVAARYVALWQELAGQ